MSGRDEQEQEMLKRLAEICEGVSLDEIMKRVQEEYKEELEQFNPIFITSTPSGESGFYKSCIMPLGTISNMEHVSFDYEAIPERENHGKKIMIIGDDIGTELAALIAERMKDGDTEQIFVIGHGHGRSNIDSIPTPIDTFRELLCPDTPHPKKKVPFWTGTGDKWSRKKDRR